MAAGSDKLSLSVVRHGDISMYIYIIYTCITYTYIHNIYKRTPCADGGCSSPQTLPLRSPTWWCIYMYLSIYTYILYTHKHTHIYTSIPRVQTVAARSDELDLSVVGHGYISIDLSIYIHTYTHAHIHPHMYINIPSVQPMAARSDKLSLSVVRHGYI